ncbi:MAG: ABC transporter substrate-binding protein, partial [Lachnospiraceae bacterium]|nr:ABC transporter substrate-binding protein [Lachnospiraceae bacterium]
MLKKSQKKFISLIAMIIMLTPLLSACGNAKDETTIRIGVLAPLSGTEAFYGNDMLNAYKLAVDEINADGGLLGRKLVLSEADDGADPNMAIQAAAKIISNNVDFVVGGY